MSFKTKGWIPYGRKAKYLHIGVEDSFKQTITCIKLEIGKDLDNKRKLKKINEFGFNIELKEDNKEDSKNWFERDMEW
jgi:hypothetical protein